MTNDEVLMTNETRMTESPIAIVLKYGPAAGLGQAWLGLRPQPASTMVRMPISLPKGGD